MASNFDYIVTIYDVNGEPLPGLTPTWKSFYDVPVGAVVNPAVSCVEVGGGIYRVPRHSVVDKHYVGILDFGVTAYPRYVVYDSRYEESKELATAEQVDALNVAKAPPYVQFTGGGATVNPVIQKVSVPRRNQVAITFSEPVVMTDALNGALRIQNYIIEGLPVLRVQELASNQVLLTTYTQAPGMRYTLTVFNVEDLNGNPISPQ